MQQAAVLIAVAVTAGSQSPYSLKQFETVGFPAWEKQFALGGPGNYSFRPNGTVPHPYSPSDVAHVRCFTGQPALDSATADKWATHINSFQLPPGSSRNGVAAGGFFEQVDAAGVSGGSLWHAAGYVTAGLRLINRMPSYRNDLFEHIAATPSLWQQTIDDLLNDDITPAPSNISSGCNSGYPCAQNIASVMAWLIMTNRNESYLDFQAWYYKHLSQKVDPVTGLWCTHEQLDKHGIGNCVGGSFHIDFVFTHAGQPFPAPLAQLNSSLKTQLQDGAWSDGNWYLNIDGIYQATRTSVQAGKARWSEVEKACDALMAHTVPQLNDMEKLLGTDISANSHILPALVSAVAECQHWFPSMVETQRKWNMCLDAVPYI